MRIWLNLDRMASLDITPEDVVNAINSQNTQAAVGRVGAAPLVPEVEFQLNISTQGRLTTVEEFNNIIVRATPDGGVVRIKDIARAELGSKSANSLVRYNGRPGEAIAIYQSPGANAIAVAAGVRKVMKEIEPRLPEDVAYDVMYDTTVFVNAMIHKVREDTARSLCAGRHRRLHLSRESACDLDPDHRRAGRPRRHLCGHVGARLLGQYDLASRAGSGDRHRRRRRDRRRRGGRAHPRNGASADPRRSSGKSDVAGDRADHRDHPRPALGIRADGLRSRHHWPALPAIRGGRVGVDGHLGDQCAEPVAGLVRVAAAPPRPSRGLIAYLQRGIDKSRDGYVALVRPLARRALISGVLVVVFALATGWLAKIVPTGFLPEEDQGAFFAEIQLPDAASLNRTNTVVAQVESMIRDRPWTQNVLTVAGYSLIDGLALPNKAIAVIGLKPFDERTDKSLSVFSALAELNPLFRQIAAANVIAFNLPPISGLGNSAGFELQLQTSPARRRKISRPSPTGSSSPPIRTRRSPASTRPMAPRHRRSI